MRISAIVATDKNNCIGKNKTIPWYLPADLMFFKATTMGHHLIMGRVCFEDIGKPLPGRTTVIITRNKKYKAKGCHVVHSLEAALELAKKNGDDEAMICGGAQIYKLALPIIQRIYQTRIDLEVESGDVYFPRLHLDGWLEKSRKKGVVDAKNKYEHEYLLLERSF